mgnify:CR=1 FL=1
MVNKFSYLSLNKKNILRSLAYSTKILSNLLKKSIGNSNLSTYRFHSIKSEILGFL